MLFNGSLASNLRFVKSAASDDELWEVIRAVGLETLITTLPDGFGQRIGPNACQLSGGQRQRLALARALLQRPRILIFDEATSCLDSSSEETILCNVQQLLPTATFIVISHRLSTLLTLDRVLVLSSGRVIADGDAFTIMQSDYSELMLMAPSKDVVISG